MGHFAKVENGIVTQVIVAEQEDVALLDGNWLKTSYNTWNNTHKFGEKALRGNYAGVGYIYDSDNDVFYPQSPYPSWVLNKQQWKWDAPVKYPSDGKQYFWDEKSISWKETI